MSSDQDANSYFGEDKMSFQRGIQTRPWGREGDQHGQGCCLARVFMTLTPHNTLTAPYIC